ncbi:C1 family peptidase [Brevundimonas sp. P7753]|uniref:C1 family peptidase n=1 Tax=Brevundimonas sp. P7753 TaxID=2726982 RepID=UPI0015C12059|nr:C1 family peptidase [Brevundimonas sp. P7753]NWE51211.1 C1 family peptidase [Brevundimonas sp. P7753]
MSDTACVRSLIGSVRDQGRRPTCLSFAASDTHQIARAYGGFFSTECLHCRAAKLGGQSSSEGVSFPLLTEALRLEGQVEESAWPYGHAGPHTGAVSYLGTVTVAEFDEATARAELKSNKAVGLALNLGEKFFLLKDQTLVSSDVTPPVARHAVVITGCRARSDIEFEVRNSWGEGWGLNGYGWLSAEFIRLSSICMFTIEPHR